MSIDVNKLEGWTSKTLGEVAIIRGGKRLPLGTSLVKFKNAHPYIKVTNLTGNEISSIDEYVPDSVFELIKNYTVNNNDLILSIVGTIGLVALIPFYLHKASLTENCVKILPDKNVLDNVYLYYYLISSAGQVEIEVNTVGAVQPKLPIYGIQNIKLLIPSIIEQKAIVDVLISLDDKIELLREQNKTLEAIAQTIFKHWFIDFEFPNSDGKPYKSSGGAMVDSELGPIPEGWRVGKLGDLLIIKNGFAFKSEDYVTNKEYPVIRTMNFEDDGYINNRNLVYITEEKAKVYRNFNFEEFDLCVVMVGASIGKTALITKMNLPSLQNQNMWSFKPKKNIYRFYNNSLIKLLIASNLGCASGSARDFFRKDFFYEVDINISEETVVSFFDKIISPIYKKISSNLFSIHKLIIIRDEMLPKLIKGELRVN